jgi:hypothetical protein
MSSRSIQSQPTAFRSLRSREHRRFLALICPEGQKPAKEAEPWRALHLLNYETDKDLQILSGQVPELAATGLNVIILELDYGFHFQA